MIIPARSEALFALLEDPAILDLLQVLEAEGGEARIVGGAIRNALLGLPVTDIDIATTLHPEETMRIAEGAGLKVIPTGLAHGTVTIIVAGRPFEVTTLREDIASNGRHAVVRFKDDFRVDAARRDFTMNALSVGRDGVLHDYFEGLIDLERRLVRFIGDPDQRIAEDYLRGLRFLRFSATYGGGHLDKAGFEAVLRGRGGFGQLSHERVRQEIFKLLAAPDAVPVMQQAEAEGLLSQVLGQGVHLGRFEKLVGAARAAGMTLSPTARLFALAFEGSASIVHLREALRLSNAEENALRQLSEALDLLRDEANPRVLAYRVGAAAREALLVAAGFDIIAMDALPAHLGVLCDPPHFGLTGKDILAYGIPPGPELGRMLAAIEAAWIAAGLPDDEAAQRQIMAATMARLRP